MRFLKVAEACFITLFVLLLSLSFIVRFELVSGTAENILCIVGGAVLLCRFLIIMKAPSISEQIGELNENLKKAIDELSLIREGIGK